MSTYSWQLPAPPSGAGTAQTGLSRATARTSLLSGLLDQEIDPATLDFIETDDGEFSETADSRSIVLCMLEMRLGKSYTAPNDGTRIAELLESGEPVRPATVVAEVTRAMKVLEKAGVLTNFSIQVLEADGKTLLVDEAGRFAPILRWTDLATGSPVDLAFTPEG